MRYITLGSRSRVHPLRSSLFLSLCAGTAVTWSLAASTHLSHLAPTPAALRAIPSAAELRQTLAVRPKRRNLFSGIATWYGNVLDGHLTASGETFDPTALTACHPTLPFGTLVRVINLRNRQSVIVRINDRGVLSPTRVIDLSAAAAEKLNMLQMGVAPVRLEIVQAKIIQTDRPSATPDPASISSPAKI